MSKKLKKCLLFILAGVLIAVSFLLFYKDNKERTIDKFIRTTYSVESIDRIEIFHEKDHRIYEDDKAIQLIMDSLKLVRLTPLQGERDLNGWIYTIKVYVDNKVADTILVHNGIVKYNQQSYKSEKNIVLVLNDILVNINE